MLVVSVVPQLGDTGWCVRGFGGAACLGSGTACHQEPLHGSRGWKKEDMVLVTERAERRLRTHARHMWMQQAFTEHPLCTRPIQL